MDYTPHRVFARLRYLLLLMVTTLAISGCDLFSDDEDKEPPSADFNVSATTGNAPLSVTFTDTSNNGTKDIFQWLWDFGDGNTSSKQHPTHEYALPGEYDVTLTVTSEHGADSLTQDNLIQVDAIPPTADFTQSVAMGDAPLTVSFTDMSTNGTGQVAMWQWDFGDGNVSTEQSPTHIYQTHGEYFVSLTVVDEYRSHTFTASSPIVVNAVPPSASFTVSATSGNIPFTVDFSDTSEPGSSAISAWAWDFGDGATSTEQHPSHTYTEEGVYSVSLSVMADGTDSLLNTDLLTAIDPYVTLTLNLLSTEGAAIESIQVESSQFAIEDHQLNEFQQLTVRLLPQDLSGVLRLKASGFTDAIVYFDGATLDQSKSVTLKALGQPFVVDPVVGGEFVTGDGAKLTVPANSLVDSDGTVVTEPVELFITTVDISDSTDRNAFPGSYLGEADDLPGEAISIASYGTVEMTFKLNDEVLQVIDGVSMELEIPLYVTQHLGGDSIFEGDAIPFWILDEESGIWGQEGYGEVVVSNNSATGYALRADTAHFSWFNADAWSYPGASPVAPGGTLPGEQVSRFCNLSVTINGPDIGDELHSWLARTSLAWPYSVIDAVFSHTGESIRSRLLSGSYYSFTVRDSDNNAAQQTFVCSGDDINITMSLPDENTPQFSAWDANLQPHFENVNGSQTITKNVLTIGGGFIQDEDNVVEVYSLAIPNGGTRLPEGTQAQYDVTQDNDLPVNVYALLENPNGQTELNFSLSYIASQAPTVISYSLYGDGEGNATLQWKTVGADGIDMFYIAPAPSTDVIPLVPNSASDYEQEGRYSFTFNEYGIETLEGYLTLRWSNQYGSVEYNIELASEVACLTDLCFTQ